MGRDNKTGVSRIIPHIPYPRRSFTTNLVLQVNFLRFFRFILRRAFRRLEASCHFTGVSFTK